MEAKILLSILLALGVATLLLKPWGKSEEASAINAIINIFVGVYITLMVLLLTTL